MSRPALRLAHVVLAVGVFEVEERLVNGMINVMFPEMSDEYAFTAPVISLSII